MCKCVVLSFVKKKNQIVLGSYDRAASFIEFSVQER